MKKQKQSTIAQVWGFFLAFMAAAIVTALVILSIYYEFKKMMFFLTQ